MKQLLESALHLFVIFMMVIFVVGAVLALTGTFDHWTERYRLKSRRKRLLRDRSQNDNMGNLQNNSTPYHSNKPDRETTGLDKNLV